jgi:uncharacterized delta-60 repeat protein
MRKAVITSVAVAALIVVAVAGPAWAAPGDLDPSFSGDGQATATFSQGPSSAEATAIQHDGRVVTAGYIDLGGSNWEWALSRFKPNGQLDPTFGNGGRVVTDWTAGDDEAWGVVVLGNGKIVAGGFAGGKFAAARYTTAGHLDHAFGGGDGKVTVDFGPGAEQAWDVAKAPGGKIVLGGQAGPASHTVVALAQLNADGTLDHGFDGDGKATEDIGPSFAWDLLPRPDGSIVVTGNADGGTHAAAMITRFTSTGAVDTSFGDAGSWTASAPDDAYANAVVRTSSGKFLVVAAVRVGSSQFDLGLFRFKSTGQVDDAFGSNGLATMDFESSELPTDLQRSGSKFLISLSRFRTGQLEQMAVVRAKADGSPDTTFGDLGLAVAKLKIASGEALAIQQDGRIVVAGIAAGSGADRMAVARFLPT